jgi:fructokinase
MRIGVDVGGTKIEAIVMGPGSRILHRERVPTPCDEYRSTLAAIAGLVERVERAVGAKAPLPTGFGTPGAISPATGRIKNSNSTTLNGQPLKQDLEELLRRPVRIANDADCLALSEASDGAGAGAPCVFAAILGTGVGGGVVVNGRLVTGPNAIGGEWGHNALPWPRPEWNEVPGPVGWEGQHGVIEAYCCGPALALDHERVTGEKRTSVEIVAGADNGDERCNATLARWEDRLARAFASIINVLDPHVIVVGGGLSRIDRLYRNVPRLWDQWVFSDRVDTNLAAALHGDSSGVRGAAWLWPEPDGA